MIYSGGVLICTTNAQASQKSPCYLVGGNGVHLP